MSIPAYSPTPFNGGQTADELNQLWIEIDSVDAPGLRLRRSQWVIDSSKTDNVAWSALGEMVTPQVIFRLRYGTGADPKRLYDSPVVDMIDIAGLPSSAL